MAQSAFAYFRGTALIQAHDLKGTPNSGIIVHSCGDCHLMNFGGFATPERNIVFDINDFNETLPAPFEWDLKRLAASFVIAARWRGFRDGQAREMAVPRGRISRVDEKAREYRRFGRMVFQDYGRRPAGLGRRKCRSGRSHQEEGHRSSQANERTGFSQAHDPIQGPAAHRFVRKLIDEIRARLGRAR
jgi:hypothetical protein